MDNGTLLLFQYVAVLTLFNTVYMGLLLSIVRFVKPHAGMVVLGLTVTALMAVLGGTLLTLVIPVYVHPALLAAPMAIVGFTCGFIRNHFHPAS